MTGLVVPQIDFSPLGQLGDIYKKAQADSYRQQTLANLGQGGPVDGKALTAAGLKLGDMSLISLGNQFDNTQYQRGRDDKNDARQASQDALAARHWDMTYGLQKAASDRAAEGPVEKAAQRERLLKMRGIDTSTPEARAFIIGGEWTGPGANAASLTPVFGTDASGKAAAVQPTKNGVAIEMKTPEGFSISREPMKVDTGTAVEFYDPQTRQLIRSVPKNVAGVESEKVRGEEIEKARLALPQVMSNSTQMLQSIDGVLRHPALDNSVGSYGMIPALPGSAGADFGAKADQLKGQTFLQAYQTLRGSGAITDIEGKKGEDAIARLDRKQSPQAYREALNDLKNVVSGGIKRAQARARGDLSVPNESQPAAAAPADPLGIR